MFSNAALIEISNKHIIYLKFDVRILRHASVCSSSSFTSLSLLFHSSFAPLSRRKMVSFSHVNQIKSIRRVEFTIQGTTDKQSQAPTSYSEGEVELLLGGARGHLAGRDSTHLTIFHF